MVIDEPRADCVAAASAEYALQEWANWFPAEFHPQVREMLYDLVYSGLVAYVECEAFRLPEPGVN
jgi:hypothetical protein